MEDGVWRTVRGRRIFIKDGQSLTEAMKESGKYNGNDIKEKIKKQFDKTNDINDVEKYKKIKDLESETKQLQDESDLAWEKARNESVVGDINTYTQEYYMDVNYYLRNGSFPEGADENYKSFVKKTINGTDKAIEQYNLKENLTTYKGTSPEYYSNYKIGETFEMKEFNSTSVSEDVAKKFSKETKNEYLLEIKVPSSTKAMYLGKNSSNANEYELLIARNTKYKVLSKNNTGMVLEVVNDVK